LEHLPATARANEVATVLCVQDFAQLQNMYGQKLAESIRNNLGNQFFGMTNNLDTAEYITKMAGEYTQVRTSVSESSQDWSETVSLGKEHYLTAHQVSTQPPGHFITKVAGRSPQFFETQLKARKLSMKPPDPIMSETRLSTLVDDQWKTIHREVQRII
jgi:type IV secretory pathway TraG/TraD family ATPase VirD4